MEHAFKWLGETMCIVVGNRSCSHFVGMFKDLLFRRPATENNSKVHFSFLVLRKKEHTKVTSEFWTKEFPAGVEYYVLNIAFEVTLNRCLPMDNHNLERTSNNMVFGNLKPHTKPYSEIYRLLSCPVPEWTMEFYAWFSLSIIKPRSPILEI
ncbi:hypothetical protein CEXT_792921 [Caerostris extrusa]|uniref:Uncharacterized protein n=1 Tax=Caerostris extrusa TaxID=172846 RepID=A0AAV4SYV9_CAEEX|nr:hypothetical protein CEXT_792921 [Caerostris extrusa]